MHVEWQCVDKECGNLGILCKCEVSSSLFPHATCRNYEGDNAVLQVKYVTDNPAAPPVFYQCADVGISK